MTKPVPFHGFIGQRSSVQMVRAQAEGAKKIGRPFPHAGLFGQSGLGKNELAKSIATEMGRDMCHIVASGESRDLSKLNEARSHDIIFIDEAHALSRQNQEALFPYLDASATIGDATQLPACTFLLATDQPGRLVNALYLRIPIQIFLSPYTENEMIDIVSKIGSVYGLAISAQARRLLARSSQGNPRMARHRVQCLTTFSGAAVNKMIDCSTVKAFLEFHSVDACNRTKAQRMYLRGLQSIGGTASIDTIAVQIGVDADFCEHQIEPFLLGQGWINKTSRGRSLTPKGLTSLTADGPEEQTPTDRTDTDTDKEPIDAAHLQALSSSMPSTIPDYHPSLP